MYNNVSVIFSGFTVPRAIVHVCTAVLYWSTYTTDRQNINRSQRNACKHRESLFSEQIRECLE